MQRRFLKILQGVVVLLFISAQTLYAQVSVYRLKQADSLYQAKQYMQSLEHYQSILKQKQYSPAMLLKMGHIEEGLNHVGEALYYLNLYYLVSNDKTVLAKMEELATKHNLEGYENSETDLALSFYRDYHFHITLALGVIALFLLSLAASIRRKKQRPVAMGIFTALILVTLFVHVNLGGKISMGIVGAPHTFLMDGPSPGASIVEVIDEGHRVKIVGKKDVWIEVLWDGEVAYVREGNLLTVML